MVNDGSDYIAVVLATAGAVAHAIGYVIQRKGHIQVHEHNNTPTVKSKISATTTPDYHFDQQYFASIKSDESITDEKKKTYVTNCLWITGFATYVSGSALAAIALRFGAQSVVAPITSLTLVCNTIFAAKFLGEKLKKHHGYGIMLVIVGSVLTVVFGPNEGPDPTIDQLKQNYSRPIFLFVGIILTTIALFDYLGVKYFQYLNINDEKTIPTDKTYIIHGKRYLMVSYICLAAYFGGLSALFIKSGVTLLATMTIEYLTDWYFYLLVFLNILVNILLEYWRQKALAAFGALITVPMYQVLYVIGASVLGAVYFDEFISVLLYELALFIVAIIITLIGVIILAFDVDYKRVIRNRWNETETLIDDTCKSYTENIENIANGNKSGNKYRSEIEISVSKSKRNQKKKGGNNKNVKLDPFMEETIVYMSVHV
eukprot:432171_1